MTSTPTMYDNRRAYKKENPPLGGTPYAVGLNP